MIPCYSLQYLQGLFRIIANFHRNKAMYALGWIFTLRGRIHRRILNPRCSRRFKSCNANSNFDLGMFAAFFRGTPSEKITYDINSWFHYLSHNTIFGTFHYVLKIPAVPFNRELLKILTANSRSRTKTVIRKVRVYFLHNSGSTEWNCRIYRLLILIS